MTVARRQFNQALLALPALAVAGEAESATTDIVLTCDTTLGPPMRAAAALFRQQMGVHVRVFPTGPGLILPQLAHGIQNDVVFTQCRVGIEAMQAGLIGAEVLQGGWRNRLVIAVPRGAGLAATRGRIAVSDPTPAADMDGPAIVQALNLGQTAVLGVIDTDEVAFLLARGEADAGLMHMTDVHAGADLEVERIVPESVAPPIDYTVAVTTLSRRPNPQAFVDFLLSPPGQAALKAQGLEA
jgi:molybdate transport system substrate-binding protein